MAINDVLPLKAARRDAIANLKRFSGTPGHQRPNVGGFIYIHYAAPHHSASRINTGWFRLLSPEISRAVMNDADERTRAIPLF